MSLVLHMKTYVRLSVVLMTALGMGNVWKGNVHVRTDILDLIAPLSAIYHAVRAAAQRLLNVSAVTPTLAWILITRARAPKAIHWTHTLIDA